MFSVVDEIMESSLSHADVSAETRRPRSAPTTPAEEGTLGWKKMIIHLRTRKAGLDPRRPQVRLGWGG